MLNQPTNSQVQQQVLSTLFALPDFQEGVLDGHHAFQEGVFFPEHDKNWSENDIIKLVEEELSGAQYKRDRRMNQLIGHPYLSYFHYIGFILGYVDQILHRKQQEVPCCTCHKPTLQAEAWPIRLTVPCSNYRDDHKSYRATGETVYECGPCWDAFLKRDEQKELFH